MAPHALDEGLGTCSLLVPAVDLVGQHLHAQCFLGIQRSRVALSCADRGHDVEALRVVHMQQITQPAAEVALFRAGLSNDEAGVTLQRRPATAPLARARAVDVFQLQRLVVQEISQPHRGTATQCCIGLQLRLQAAPVLRRQRAQSPQHVLLRPALQVDVAARRQAAETVFDAVHQFAARQAGEARQQAVEAEFGAVLADEVEYQAALLAGCQAQAAANLLLKQHRALRGPQQQQRVDHRQVDAFVVEINRDQRAQFAAEQTLRRPAAVFRVRRAHHAGGRQACTVQPVGHELGMCDRHAEHEGTRP